MAKADRIGRPPASADDASLHPYAVVSPRAAVVYNPTSMAIDRLRELVGAEEQRLGRAPTRWYPTDAADSGSAAARRALADEPDLIMIAGGDGTVRAVAEAVQMSAAIPIALLALGTGNLLARNLNIPVGDLAAAVRTAFEGETRKIDTGVAELRDEGATRRHTFVVMAGIGLDAAMASDTQASAKKRIGWLAYVSPIARSVLGNRHVDLKYRIDDQRIRSARAHTIIVGNCGTLTGDMQLLPDADVEDGLLDVVMFRPQTRFGWARIGTRLTFHNVARRSRLGRRALDSAPPERALVYTKGRDLRVRFDAAQRIELDGDDFGTVTSARVTVRPASLAIRV